MPLNNEKYVNSRPLDVSWRTTALEFYCSDAGSKHNYDLCDSKIKEVSSLVPWPFPPQSFCAPVCAVCMHGCVPV